MKHTHLFTIAALFAAIFPACGQKETPAKEEIKISANPTALYFESEGNGDKTVTVKFNSQPSTKTNDSWINVECESIDLGYNTETLKVSVKDNDTASERNGSFTVSDNSGSVTVSVSQKAAVIPIKVDVTSLEADYTGKTFWFEIKSGVKPNVNSNKSWCKVLGVEEVASGTYQVGVACGINTDAQRTANITVSCPGQSVTVGMTQKAYSLDKYETQPISPSELKSKLGLGWNLGNQFDANNNGLSSETAWGNGKVTQATFNAVAAAGFQTVRIPITWLGHIGEAPLYTIEEKWLNRIEEVVGFAHNSGLNVVINIHHDDANSANWLSVKDAAKSATKQAEIIAQLSQMWYQIASRFAGCGDWLIMEMCNEPQDGGWGWGDNRNDGGKQYNALNEWNDAFVKAVRAAGGENRNRWLTMVPYSCSPDLVSNLVIPEDYVTSNRQIVAVHFYSPTNYTLECQFSEWGHSAAAGKKDSWGDEDSVRETFNTLKANYPDKGIPMYIGEFGNSARSDARAKLFRKYYLEYVCKCVSDCGFPMFVWDNGATNYGKECHGYFKHADGSWINDAEEVVAVMMRGYYCTDEGYTLESVYNSAPAAE